MMWGDRDDFYETARSAPVELGQKLRPHRA
jgi:hypothetical protein